MRQTLLMLTALVALTACVDRERDDDTDPNDAASSDAEIDDRVDAAIGSDAELEPDAAPEPDAEPEPDAALPDAEPEPDAEPDFGPPPPPEECNGLDEDLDGEIDEGLTNVCGGCEELPDDGTCQAWRLSVSQGVDGSANLQRMIGFQGAFNQADIQEIDNASCQIVRSVVPDPEAHLGDITVTTDRIEFTQTPVFSNAQGTIIYRSDEDPPLNQARVFSPGDEIEISGSGSELSGEFVDQLVGPDVITGVEPDALADIIQLARGNIEESVELSWTPARTLGPDGPDISGQVQLFVGGSLPIFNRNVYRAIRSFTLNGVLRDDGAIDLDADLFAPALPLSAVRVRLSRTDSKRVLLGPDALEMRAEYIVERVQSGDVSGGLESPFDILTPDPDVREITPGDPMLVEWSPLPEGEGPLTVSLVLLDPIRSSSTQISCEVTDPTTGVLVLPGEFTADWPVGEGARRLLDVRWTLQENTLRRPDQGTMVQNLSLILDLEE